jgi:hypothetical protein
VPVWLGRRRGQAARRQKEFKEGRGNLRFLLRSAERRVDAELALAGKPAERLRHLQQYRRDLEEIDTENQRRFDAKDLNIQDLMDSKSARLGAEIRLAEIRR